MVKGSIFLVFLVLSAGVFLPSEAISCFDITPSVMQCSSFALGSVAQPSGGCCNELKRLEGMAKTTEDRRQLCYCYKQLAPQYPGVQDPKLVALTQLCGVSLPFIVSRDIDCSKVS